MGKINDEIDERVSHNSYLVTRLYVAYNLLGFENLA